MLDNQPYAWQVGETVHKSTYGAITHLLRQGLGMEPGAWLEMTRETTPLSPRAFVKLLNAIQTAFLTPADYPPEQSVSLLTNFLAWVKQEGDAQRAIRQFEARHAVRR